MDVKLPKPKAILFDWDGTIIRLSNERFLDSSIKTFKQLGYRPLASHEIEDTDSITDSLAKRIKNKVELQVGLNLFYKYFSQDVINDEQLMPGARDLINKLRAYKVPTAVVSNLDTVLLHNQLRMVGLHQHFDLIIGAEEGRAIKPDPAPLLAAINGLGLRPSRSIWFVGDTLATDIKAATLAGCTSFYLGEVLVASISIKPDVYVEGGLRGLEKLIDRSIGTSYCDRDE